MARYPGATWRGSPNVGGSPVRPARGLVVHVEVGTETGTDACFRNPWFKASAHFGVANDGSIDQWVDTDDVAWAEVAGNSGWISVETEGTPDVPLTDAQVAACGALLAWCASLYAFPLAVCDHDGTGVTTHAHYPSGAPDASWGGHLCPGTLRSAQLPAIIAAASGSSPGDDDMPKAYLCEDPQSGGTWAVLTDDGEVDTADGAPYLGALNNHPEFHALDPAHPIVGVAPWKDPSGNWGYKIGEYDPAPPAGQGRVRYYRFPRDGSLAH